MIAVVRSRRIWARPVILAAVFMALSRLNGGTNQQRAQRYSVGRPRICKRPASTPMPSKRPNALSRWPNSNMDLSTLPLRAESSSLARCKACSAGTFWRKQI